MPDRRIRTIFDLDLAELKENGIQGLIYDLDNTLLPWGSNEIEDLVVQHLDAVNRLDLRLGILSNDHGTERAILAERIPTEHIIYRAQKPHYLGFLKMQERLGLPPKQLAMIGDQIFTDIWGANRLGIFSILVDPCGPDIDEFSVKVRRFFERQLLKSYEQKAHRKISL